MTTDPASPEVGPPSGAMSDTEEPVQAIPAGAGSGSALVWREGSDRAWVPEHATFQLALPNRPRSAAALRRALAQAAPLPPDALAWTDPEPLPGGGACVTIVRRDWLAAQLALAQEVAARHLSPWAKADGKPFRDPPGAAAAGPDRRVTIAWVLFGLALGTAGLWASMRPAPVPDPALLTPASPIVRDGWRALGIATPPVGPALAGLPPSPPASGELVAVAADAGGLTVSYAAADPDRLRAALQGDPGSAGLSLIGQSRLGDGRYQVDFTLPGPPPGAAAASGASPAIAAPMPASGAGVAQARAAARLRTLAQARALALTIAPAGTATPGPGIDTAPAELRFVALGPADAVLGLARALESDGPPMRLRRWRLRADAAGVRLDAELVVPWRPAP